MPPAPWTPAVAVIALAVGTGASVEARAQESLPFHLVALGDSYASGQGAPDENFKCWKFWRTPRWQNRRCNRSWNAPASQAASRLRAEGYDVEFDSFACSGATIYFGLIGPYDGAEPPKGPHTFLFPQVEELAALDSLRPVDALTISIGGNDILFGPIVAACSAPIDCRLEPLKELVRERLANLPGRLDRLAVSLQGIVEPAGIFIVAYPNPATDSDGSYCDGEPSGDPLAGIDEAEARWAGEWVLPRLNRALCKAAKRHGWTYVRGTAFEGHGWCARDSWINTFRESARQQASYRGTVHPNVAGHSRVADKLVNKIRPLLEGNTPSSDVCP